jgi:hypothetical protein
MFTTPSHQLGDLLLRICNSLQITQTQHKSAEEHYNAIGNWLATGDGQLFRLRPEIYSQGSFRIGTTVKPREREEYDVDLVCEFQADPRLFPNPVMLLDLIEARLRQHGDYASRLKRKNRCIRVVYTRNFYLDILPACPDPSGEGTCLVVPDRNAGCWKASNPKGYASWFDAVASTRTIKSAVEHLPAFAPESAKPVLVYAVQLLKRWRDVFFRDQPDLAPISIVLTTLAGNCYADELSVPEALTGILDRIVQAIPTDGTRLIVRNPSNDKEDLSEKWGENPRAYSAFTTGMRSFLRSWKALIATQGIPEVTVALSMIFGEELTRRVVEEQAEALQKARKKMQVNFDTRSKSLVGVAGISTIPVRPTTFFGE